MDKFWDLSVIPAGIAIVHHIARQKSLDDLRLGRYNPLVFAHGFIALAGLDHASGLVQLVFRSL